MADKNQSEPEIWPDPVDGAELLNEIRNLLNKYGIYRDGCTEAIALWILFTYVFDEFDVCPLLIITSPEKRCGKTRTLRIIGKLVHKPIISSNISTSALFRMIDKKHPTLLIDEADSFLIDGRNEMINILNSGHTRDAAYVYRSVPSKSDDWEPKKFSAWSPKCIAYIDKKKPADTLTDRAIEIPMRRKKRSEKVEALRASTLKDLGKDLQKKARRWANDNGELLRNRETEIEIPNELHDRQADNWAPLLAIAEMASKEWLTKAERSAIILSQLANEEDVSDDIQLLRHCRQILREKGNPDRIHTEDLMKGLNKFSEYPWGDYMFSKKSLAEKLKNFDIKPKPMRIDGGKPKRGYERYAFEDVFSRYLSE